MENYVRKILETVKKYPDKKIIVKLHPGRVSYDIKPLIQKIDPSIQIFQNENILDLLEKSDVMISLNYSTVVLDALIFMGELLAVFLVGITFGLFFSILVTKFLIAAVNNPRFSLFSASLTFFTKLLYSFLYISLFAYLFLILSYSS